MATAYCVKCRRKVDIRNPRNIILKNKRPAIQGVCPSCGTKVFRIGKG
jgi:DNA-directed RNA polymerase subunit RPC12/RpoP